MLFFNFICLFYLMVLVTSHTISKSIAATEKIDNVIDTLNDIKYIHEPKRDKLYLLKRQEAHYTTTAYKALGGLEKTKHVPGLPTAANINVTKRPRKKIRKIKGLWRKYQHRGKENKITTKIKNGGSGRRKRKNKLVKKLAFTKLRHTKNSHHVHKSNINLPEMICNNNSLKYTRSENNVNKIKRNIILQRKTPIDLSPAEYDDVVERPQIQYKRSFTKPELDTITFRELFNSTSQIPINYVQSAHEDDLSKILVALTTQVDNLKMKYRLNDITPVTTSDIPQIVNKVKVTSFQPTKVIDAYKFEDYQGTAEIETLLNDVKMRAIDMIASHNPAITNMITNTVRETTFRSGSLSDYFETVTPGYALNTIIFNNDIPLNDVKRTVDLPTTEITNQPNHIIKSRSIYEHGYTIAQNMEDKLQCKLHKIYHKVRNKIKSDFNKEVKEAKTVINQQTPNILKKITGHCPKFTKMKLYPKTTLKYKPKTTPTKRVLSGKHTRTPDSTTDLKFTTLRIRRGPTKLLKKYRTTNKYKKLKKSLPTLATPSFEDDYGMLSVYEQMLSKTHQDNMMKYLSTKNTPNMRYIRDIDNYPPEPNSETTTLEDTSYEGLSNKLSYNDFVNGYKHYLKFQKEEANQNFSNLVRYQAHRHHNVDDIGKYILEKIPQIPSNPERDKRNFFDYYDEDQDISTKSDDSWFKKHFYFFLDSGPQKKYHTSQTVSLKSASSQNHDMDESTVTHSTTINQSRDVKYNDNNQVNLEGVSEYIDDQRPLSTSTVYESFTSSMPEQEIQPDSIVSSHLFKKLFGNNERSSKSNINFDKNDSITRELNRFQRSDTKTDKWSNVDSSRCDKPTLNSEISGLASKNNVKSIKNGYASVDVVPSDKVKGPKKKESKIRKWFKKLKSRNHKGTKNKSRIKRSSLRRRRFNPFQNIEKIFSSHKNIKSKPAGSNTLTHVNHAEIQTVDKIKNNVTDIASATPEKNVPEKLIVRLDKRKLGSRHKDAEWDNLEYNVAINSGEGSQNPSSRMTPSILKAYLTTEKLSTNWMNNKNSIIQRLSNIIDSSDNLKRMEKYFTAATAPIHDINKYISKMHLPFDFKSKGAMSTRDSRCQIENQKTTVSLHQQANYPESAKSLRANFDLFPLSRNEKYNEEMEFNSQIDKPIIQALFDNKETSSRSGNLFPHVKPRKPNPTKHIHNSLVYKTSKKYTTQQTSPDYFNDLYIWNSDILHSDHSWESILRNATNNEPTISNIKEKYEDIKQAFSDLAIRRNHYSASANRISSTPVTPYLISTSFERSTNPKVTQTTRKKTKDVVINPTNVIRNIVLKDNVVASNSKTLVSGEENNYQVEDHPNLNTRLKAPDEEKTYSKDVNYNGTTLDLDTNTDDLYVDTSIFAYDDVLSLLNNLQTTKMSKSSYIRPISKRGDATTAYYIKTITTPPAQYYTTPLPMKKSEFDKFLKENYLDVVTATRSNNDIKQLEASLPRKLKQSQKIRGFPSTKFHIFYKTKKTQILKQSKHKSEEWELLKPKSHQILINEGKKNKEFKSNFSINRKWRDNKGNVNNENYWTNANIFGNKKKLFHDDEKITEKGLNSVLHASNEDGREVDLTLINFDNDRNNIVVNEHNLGLARAGDNNRLENIVGAVIETNPPKRVRISSHTYQYDVEYDNPNKRSTTNFRKEYSKTRNARAYREMKAKNAKLKRQKRWPGRHPLKIKSQSGIMFTEASDTTCTTIKAIYTKKEGTEKKIDNTITSQVYETVRSNKSSKRIKRNNSDQTGKTNNSTNQNQSKINKVIQKHYEPRLKYKQRTISPNQDNGEPINLMILKQSRSDGKIHKRDIEKTFTAKGVAALEVIVDLIKNTLKPSEVPSREHLSLDSFNSSNNMIQVHVTIPYNAFKENDAIKRSLKSNGRLRKVFIAKMSTPVDLEYQIQSFENFYASTPPTVIPPGMYLLVANNNDTDGNAMILPKCEIRQAAISKPIETKTTSAENYFSKVTLSKDFVAAVNKHLVQLYENLVSINETDRKIAKKQTVDVIKTRRKRNGKIMKLFGNKRVCSCHCKANRTMCRACAACDKVITELMFEIDYLIKYVNDHCAEMQTFFRMNPNGGQKLKESVHKLYKALNDYYKKNNRKCDGRVCEAFRYTDKRDLTQKFNHTGHKLTDAILTFVKDLNHATKLKVCHSKEFREKNSKFLNKMAQCCTYKHERKRSESYDRIDVTRNQENKVKNVYSLDNVNVNIICSSDRSYERSTNPMDISTYNFNSHEFNYDSDEEIGRPKSQKLLRNFFFGNKYKQKKPFFTKKYTIDIPKNFKREIDRVICPLNADTGGTFWNDYINKINLERSVKVQENNNKNQMHLSNKTQLSNSTKVDEVSNISSYTTSVVNSLPAENDLTSNAEVTAEPGIQDSLNNNINELFKIFSNLHEVEIYKTTTESFTTKPKYLQSAKRKVYINKTSDFTKTLIKSTNKKYASVIDSNNLLQNKAHDYTNNTSNTTAPESLVKDKKTSISPNSTTKSVVKTTQTAVNRFVTIPYDLATNKTKATSLKKIKSENHSSTNTGYPTIIIITNDESSAESNYDEFSTTSMLLKTNYNEREGYKSLLLSLLKYETKKLGEDWQKYVDHDSEFKIALNKDDDISGSEVPFEAVLGQNLTNFKPNAPNTVEVNQAEKDAETVTSPQTSEPQPTQKLKSNSSFNKILNKFAILFIPGMKKRKAFKRQQQKELNSNSMANQTEPSFVQKLKVANNSNDKSKGSYGSLKHNDETWHQTIESAVLTNNSNHIKRDIKEVDDSGRICDVEATFNHVMSLQHQMTSKEFEELVKNVDCYRKRKIPDYFYINLKKSVEKTKQKKSKMDSPLDIKHDWYSNGHKRSLFSLNARDLGKDDDINEFDDPSEDFDKNDRIEIVENVDHLSYETPAVQNNLLYEEFQKLYIGADGVYRSSKERMKRSSDLKTLSRHLRNLPSLLIPMDHVYVIQGDMVVMSCDPSKLDSDVSWSAEGDLLNQDNAIVGDTVVIEDINVKNAGSYTCSKGGAWHRSMQLVVVALPYFQINSQPIYEINKRCTSFDLKSAQFLGKEMAQVACFEERYCSLRIERPACLRDTEKSSWLVSLTAAMVVSPRHVQCGLQCQRDLHCSLALLSAGNAPVLESIKVMVAMKDTNRTWLPASRQDRTFIVTRTLKGKESNCMEEHGRRNADLEPGDVAITATCPPGFYLVSESKICFAIPPKRYKDSAYFEGHKRLKSGGADLSASSVCACAWALCALASAAGSRAPPARHVSSCLPCQRVITTPKLCSSASAAAAPARLPARACPLTPPASVRTGDTTLGSQETRLVLYKKIPPPLPPVDFD